MEQTTDGRLPLIRLHNVSKTYDLGEIKVRALRQVSLDIEQGDYVALMGQSGSGKSTLMNTLGCLDRPTEGSYLLGGEEVVTMSRDARAKLRNQRMGFVFQNFNLLARTSALENVELPLMYGQHLSVRERRQRAIEELERVGLADRLDHHPSQLSGGQQQRVAIARALVNRPSILMADEPTGNLDTATSADVMRLFSRLNEETKLTIVVVTHDADIARFSRRVIVLRDGRIERDTSNIAQPAESFSPQPTDG